MKDFKKIICVLIALWQTFMLIACGKEPIEMVQIPGQNYKMSTTEITQKFYESIMGENPSEFKGENNPVESVSWYDAIYFCNKLSEKYGYTPVYSVNGTTDVTKWNYTPHQEDEIYEEITQNTSANGFRLPTNAEWGYAAKGGQNYKYAGSNNIDEVAWYWDNSDKTTHPVAQKKANGYGLYDMSGNVLEWCWDSQSDEDRYLRGCAWFQSTDYCDVSLRFHNDAYDCMKGIGFRLACTIETVQKSIEKDFIEMVQIPGQNYNMSKTEITQKLYESVMLDTPSHFRGENNPVECVSWYDAVYFCNKLSEKCGYTPVYSVNGTTDVTKWNYTPHNEDKIDAEITQNTSANGFRLPTMDEWKYAAKGGQNYEYAGSDNIDEIAWYSDNSGETTHPVAQKKANGYGLYDMNGNVWEWCWNGEDYRCSYGCSWSSSTFGCSIGIDFYEACNRYKDIGFRIVRTIKPKEKKSTRGKEPIEMVQIPRKNYKMSTTEITQKFYESVMGENPSKFKGENNPVENVSWYDAIYFCNKLSVKYGYTPVYSVDGNTDVTKWNYTPHKGGAVSGNVAQNTSADGFRLPTEDEWGYTAKGGQNYKYAGSDNIAEIAWYEDNSGETTHPVAQKKANGYGLYDMSGNVSEWCWGGDLYILHGGSWFLSTDYCTAYDRFYASARERYSFFGFRVARTVE